MARCSICLRDDACDDVILGPQVRRDSFTRTAYSGGYRTKRVGQFSSLPNVAGRPPFLFGRDGIRYGPPEHHGRTPPFHLIVWTWRLEPPHLSHPRLLATSRELCPPSPSLPVTMHLDMVSPVAPHASNECQA